MDSDGTGSHGPLSSLPSIHSSSVQHVVPVSLGKPPPLPQPTQQNDASIIIVDVQLSGSSSPNVSRVAPAAALWSEAVVSRGAAASTAGGSAAAAAGWSEAAGSRPAPAASTGDARLPSVDSLRRVSTATGTLPAAVLDYDTLVNAYLRSSSGPPAAAQSAALVQLNTADLQVLPVSAALGSTLTSQPVGTSRTQVSTGAGSAASVPPVPIVSVVPAQPAPAPVIDPALVDHLTTPVWAHRCTLCSFVALRKQEVGKHLQQMHQPVLERMSTVESKRSRRRPPPPPASRVVSASEHAQCVVNIHGKVSVRPCPAANTEAQETPGNNDVDRPANTTDAHSDIEASPPSATHLTEGIDANPVQVANGSDVLSGNKKTAGDTSRALATEPSIPIKNSQLPPNNHMGYTEVSIGRGDISNAPSAVVHAPRIEEDAMEVAVRGQVEPILVTEVSDGRVPSGGSASDVPWMGGSRELSGQLVAEASVRRPRLTLPRKRGRPRDSRTLGLSSLPRPAEAERALGLVRCDVPDCGLRLRDAGKLELHRRCHVAEARAGWRCYLCGAEEVSWVATSKHLWQRHRVDVDLYHCDQCDYRTPKYSTLVSVHKLTHGEARDHICVTCGKAFKNHRQLLNHRSKHRRQMDPLYAESCRCDQCDIVLSDKRSLKIHIRMVHEKRRDFQCSECGRTFSCRSSLMLHARLHSGAKRFNCDHCSYASSDHNTLRRHRMRHTGERPYSCPHCEYACIQAATFKKHLASRHPTKATSIVFSCPHCVYTTIQRSTYNRHVRTHTDAERAGAAKIASVPLPGDAEPETVVVSDSEEADNPTQVPAADAR